MFAGRCVKTWRTRNCSELLVRGLGQKHQVSGNMVEQLEEFPSSGHQKKYLKNIVELFKVNPFTGQLE